MEPSWRKPAGMIGLLCYIALYAALVVQFAESLSALPKWLELVAYLILGVVWIAPLKPLFLWMNTGRWRLPK
jgi:predicted membrane channel-forming protein YqfA (hemolysin III family)